MKSPITIWAASIAGLAGFGWTLTSYRSPDEPPPQSASAPASYNQPPNHGTLNRWPRGPRTLAELSTYLDHNPGDPQTWSRLGWAQHAAGDDAAAKRSWTQAAALQGAAAPPEAGSGYFYDLACYLALAGEREGALTAWNGCVDAGWDNPGYAQQDPDLDSIRDDPRFVEGFNRIVPHPGGVVRVGAG